MNEVLHKQREYLRGYDAAGAQRAAEQAVRSIALQQSKTAHENRNAIVRPWIKGVK